MHVNLREDGTIAGEMNGEPTDGLWFADGDTVIFSMNGDTESGRMEGELLVLRGEDSSMSFSRSISGETTPAPAPADLGRIGLQADVKYAAESITVTASGAVIPGENMAEYAVTFHTDGTAEFVMAGVPVSGLSWTTEGDVIVLDYFDKPIRFTPEDGTILMDFFGSMLMKMVPQI